MQEKTPQRRVLFAHCLRMVGAAVFAVCSILVCLIATPARTATAATDNTVNFQARLMTASGGIVPDGNYNVEFKLYNALSSSGSSQGSCAGDANCLWTETRVSGNKVRVANGYLTVNLGSVTTLPTTINWDQDLYLGMNIGGSGTATWDGEMTPRLHLTAVPYAFRAGQLATLNGANTATLGFTAPTANDSILLPDASGTVCLQGAAACGFLTGSPSNYIQNTTSPQAANIDVQAATSGSVAAVLQANVGGTGDILDLKNGSGTPVATFGSTGTILLQNSVDSIAAFTIKNAAGTGTLLNVDTSNGRVGVGGAAAASKFEVQGGDAAIYNNGGNPRLILGDTTSDYGYLQWDSANNYFRIETVGTNGLKINDNNVSIGNIFPSQPLTVGLGTTQLFQITSTGTILQKTSTNATNALQVQSSTSAPVFDVDTSNGRVGVGTATPTRALDVAVSTASVNALPLLVEQAGTGDAGIEVKSATQSYYVGADSTDGNFKISSNTAAGTTTVLGTNSIGASVDSNDQNTMNATKFTASATGTLSTLYGYISTVDTAPNNKAQMAIYTDSSGSPGTLLGNSASVTLTAAAFNAFPITPVGVTSGTVYWLVYNTNSSSNSKNNFKLGAGTTNQAKYVAQTYGTWPAWSGGTFANTNASFYGLISTLSPTDEFSTSLFSLGNTGQALFQNSADSTTAFRIQNAAGTSNLFSADTTNTRIAIGQATATYTLDVAGDINSTTQIRVGGTVVCTSTGCTPSAGSNNYIRNQATVQAANLYVQAATSGSVAAVLQANAAGTGDIVDYYNGSSALVGSMSSTGNVLVKPSTNSTTAFQVQNSTGTAALNVNTATGAVDISTTPANEVAALTVTGGISVLSLIPPTGVASSVVGTTGATTYTYVVTACDDTFCTKSSIASSTTTVANGNATLSGTNYVHLTWNPVAGAEAYGVYRTVGSTIGFLNTVPAGATTYNDTSTFSFGGAAPTTPTSGSFSAAASGLFGQNLTVGGATSTGSEIIANVAGGVGTLLNVGGSTGLSGSYPSTVDVQGGIYLEQLPTPSAPSVTPKGTTGATTYTYYIAACSTTCGGAFGVLSTPSSGTVISTGNATLSGTNYNQVTWSTVSGAAGYAVYQKKGAVTSLVAEVSGGLNTYNDTGTTIISGTTLPVVNSTGNIYALGAIQAPSGGFNTVDTQSGATLNIGLLSGGNATQINLNQATTITGALTQSGGAISLSATGTATYASTSSTSLTASGSITITASGGSTWSTSSGNLTVQAAGTSALTLQTGGAGTVSVGDQNTTTINIGRGSNIARTISIGTAGTSAAQTIAIGSVGGTSTLALSGGTGSGAISLATGTNGNIAATTTGTGTITLGSATSVIAKASSLTAFQVQNASAVSTLSVDTTDGKVGVGTTGPTEALSIQGNINVADNVASPTKNLRIRTSGSGIDLEGGGADVYFSDWTGAGFTGTQLNFFRAFIGTVGNSYTDNGLFIGNGSTVTNPTVLVLSNKTASTDPANATYNGAMYYNAGLSAFRCYEGNEWRNCVSSVQSFGIANAASATTTTSATYVNYPGTSSVSFTKLANGTKLSVQVTASFWSTVNATAARLGVLIAGTDYDCSNFLFNTASQHTQLTCTIVVSGVGSGAQTAQLQWRRVSGTGVLTTDTNDWVTLHVQETD